MTKHIPDRFTLGHSPDPDDAFMFYAMAENKIDLRGYRFDHRLEDIQTLNERARRGELHISAISIHAYAYVANSRVCVRGQELCAAAVRREHGRRIRTSGCAKTLNAQRSTLNAQSGLAAPACDRRAGRDDKRVSGAAAFSGKV